MDDNREVYQKLPSDIIENVQERSLENHKMPKALFAGEVFRVQPTQSRLSTISESNVDELNERLGVLEKLMMTNGKDMEKTESIMRKGLVQMRDKVEDNR